MSEYWKSTPKYWCKHCSVYVKDTKFERSNHESTSKHQSNLNKFLRNIHRDNEREKRESQRAKDEVARLNGLEPGSENAVKRREPGNQATTKSLPPRQATMDDRKRQMAQLAEMGVAVPDAFRKDLAIAGDWQNVSNLPGQITASSLSTPEDRKEIKLADLEISKGLKRKSDETETDTYSGSKRPAWGSKIKTFSSSSDSQAELDSILQECSEKIALKSKTAKDGDAVVKEEGVDAIVKKEEDEALVTNAAEIEISQTMKLSTDTPDTAEGDEEVTFKKRKPKKIKK